MRAMREVSDSVRSSRILRQFDGLAAEVRRAVRTGKYCESRLRVRPAALLREDPGGAWIDTGRIGTILRISGTDARLKFSARAGFTGPSLFVGAGVGT